MDSVWENTVKSFKKNQIYKEKVVKYVQNTVEKLFFELRAVNFDYVFFSI